MRFAHWKNIMIPRGFPGHDGEHRRDAVPYQTGPGGELGPIQFIEDIPNETTRAQAVTKWVLQPGVRVDDQTDGMGFERDWPDEVRNQFVSGDGIRHKWIDLC